MAYIEIKNLTFSYPACDKPALKNINLTVSQGEYITICGKSGSGKSTLLRHLKPVLTPHGKRDGTIIYNGNDISDLPLYNQASEIGYVMQNPENQLVTDKVWHELAFGLESLGCDQKTMRLRVCEMASYFGLESLFHKNVNELSGGQKQLINLASVMAMQPSLLILDEPTSQLDPIAAADFLNTVRKINLELGTTVIISEHRLEQIFDVSDRIIVMDGGSITADDKPAEVGRVMACTHNDMFESMPSCVKIFYKTKSKLMCPLNVRDGRNWLTESFKNCNILHDCIQDDTPQCDNNNDYAVQIKDVWMRYEKKLPDVLKGLNLNIPKRGVFAVVGGNGTGKSTMLKTVCGLEKSYRGKIIINGKSLASYKNGELFEKTLAMLPQDPQTLFVKKSVREELDEMLEEKKCTSEYKEKLLNKIIEICDLKDILQAHPYDLSGGEQQRAALAKVLLCEPEILLLDEPTKGMDNFYKQKLADVFCKLKNSGVTIIMVTHDIEFCAKYADYVSLFFDGASVTVNTPGRFFASNSFYTTSANRMSRHIFKNAVTDEDVISLFRLNKQAEEYVL